VTIYVAFLRGINLGRRQIKMAELRACLEELGLTEVKTILASGNVRFSTDRPAGLKAKIEKALAERFGFAVGVVLRTREEIAAMLDGKPFAGVEPGADVMRYVLLFDAPLDPLPNFSDLPGHLDIARIDPREIYIVAHKLPNGRYSEGMEQIDRQLPNGVLVTTRNWNTIEKAVA
jgi:uncharacterized protein (DUF1697 family)